MIMAVMELTEEDFEARYKPQPNLLNKNASFSGCMFETYGPELEAVEKVFEEDPGRVWTILESDDGELSITNGMQFVNRHGYLITEVAAKDDEFIEVSLD